MASAFFDGGMVVVRVLVIDVETFHPARLQVLMALSPRTNGMIGQTATSFSIPRFRLDTYCRLADI